MNSAAFEVSQTSSCPIPLWKFYFPNQGYYYITRIFNLKLLEWNSSNQYAIKVEAWSRRLSENGFQDIVDSIIIVIIIMNNIPFT